MLAPHPERLAEFDRRLVRRVAHFFDLDGTVFAPQLTNEIMFGIAKRYPDREHMLAPVREAYAFYKEQRTYDYTPVHAASVVAIHAIFTGLKEVDIIALTDELVPRVRAMTYLFTRTMLKHLSAMPIEERGLIVAITGSPQGLADRFVAPFGVDLVYGAQYLTEGGVYTGDFGLQSITDKGSLVDEVRRRFSLDLGASTAFGDSDSDIPMLDRVGFPFAVNPQANLLAHARASEKIVVVNDRQKYGGVTMFRSYLGRRLIEIELDLVLPSYITGFPHLPGMLQKPL